MTAVSLSSLAVVGSQLLPRQTHHLHIKCALQAPTSNQWQLVNPVHEARGCPDSYEGGDTNANDCGLLVCLVPLGLQAGVASMIKISRRQWAESSAKAQLFCTALRE